MPDPISWELVWPYYLATLAASYLLGSIPFGILMTRLAGLGDLRKIGSGNIGATNVLRTGRKDLAALTLALDGGKGAAAVLIAGNWGPDPALIAAFGSVLGHIFPPWLAFKGGKGVATLFGALIALAWPVGLAVCGTWLLSAVVFRISSLSALIATAASPLFAWYFMKDLQMVELTAALALLAWFRHHENIGRLIRGQEPRIGKRQRPKADS